MKNTLFCLALLMLASCLPVDDFGLYWNKGVVDTALLGKWQEIPQNTAEIKPDHDLSPLQVTQKDGAYQIDSLNAAEREKTDYAPMPAKTLTVGSYTFLMVMNKDDNKEAAPSGDKRDAPSGAKRDTPSGDMVRYKIDGGAFREYFLNPEKTAAFLKDKYPEAANITRSPCAGKCLYDGISIKKFDDAAYKALAGIPDTPDFWTPAASYRKVLP